MSWHGAYRRRGGRWVAGLLGSIPACLGSRSMSAGSAGTSLSGALQLLRALASRSVTCRSSRILRSQAGCWLIPSATHGTRASVLLSVWFTTATIGLPTSTVQSGLLSAEVPSGVASSRASDLSGHLVASAGLPVVSVRQGCNIALDGQTRPGAQTRAGVVVLGVRRYAIGDDATRWPRPLPLPSLRASSSRGRGGGGGAPAKALTTQLRPVSRRRCGSIPATRWVTSASPFAAVARDGRPMMPVLV